MKRFSNVDDHFSVSSISKTLTNNRSVSAKLCIGYNNSILFDALKYTVKNMEINEKEI